jgi:hypothetical protein
MPAIASVLPPQARPLLDFVRCSTLDRRDRGARTCDDAVASVAVRCRVAGFRNVYMSGACEILGCGMASRNVDLTRRAIEKAWGEEIRVEPETFFDLGDRSLVYHVLRGRGQQSGADVALAGALVFRWRDGLIVNIKSYLQRGDALSELGVSEGELEPIAP